MKKISLIIMLMAACLSYVAFNLNPRENIYAYNDVGTTNPTVVPPHRGFTDVQDQPCFNDHTKEHYESELISKSETAHYLLLAGATVEQADVLAAISRAESGSQLNCFGDDSDKYYGQPVLDINNRPTGKHWGESYGLYQIRTIIEDSNTGSCRDIERLRLNIAEQSACAYEISRSGTNFGAWSVTHANRGKPYLKYIGKDW